MFSGPSSPFQSYCGEQDLNLNFPGSPTEDAVYAYSYAFLLTCPQCTHHRWVAKSVLFTSALHFLSKPLRCGKGCNFEYDKNNSSLCHISIPCQSPALPGKAASNPASRLPPRVLPAHSSPASGAHCVERFL